MSIGEEDGGRWDVHQVDRSDVESSVLYNTTRVDESITSIGDELLRCDRLDVRSDIVGPLCGRCTSREEVRSEFVSSLPGYESRE